MTQAGMNVRRTNRKSAAERAREKRMAQFNAFMLKVTVALIAICMFVYIGRMTTVTAGVKEIELMEKEIRELEDEHKYLECWLEEQQNINRVRDEAEGRLGMAEAHDGQIILISLNGYTSSANTQTAHDGVNP